MMPLATLALVATSTLGDAELARRWHREAVEWERLAQSCGSVLRSERDQLSRCRERLALACPPLPRVEPEAPPIARYASAGLVGAALAAGVATGLACDAGPCRAQGAGVAGGLLALALALLW
jgi:hypothetical protein